MHSPCMTVARRLAQRTALRYEQPPTTSTCLPLRSSPPAAAATAAFGSLARPIGQRNQQQQQQQSLRPLSSPAWAPFRHLRHASPITSPSSSAFFSSASGTEELDGGFPTERDFHLSADATLDEVQALVDTLEDTVDDYEANISQGVLNILMGDAGTWVLNKQTPNRQIWWSSPLSGPLRFEYDPALQQWVTTRGRKELFTLLAEEVQKVAGVDFQARLRQH